jgi:plastocyanin
VTRRLLLIASTGLCAVALVWALSAPASTTVTTLVGTTGPEAVITLKKAGKRVTRLKPGKYRLVVRDRERVHDFHLRGPGMRSRMITDSFFQGTKTVVVTLKKGRYTYYCDPHEFAGMKGSFTVK